MPTPGFLFDAAARRFRDASGKFVPSRVVRDAVDSLAAGVGGEMRAEAIRLQSGEINGSEFTLRMKRLIKAAHVATGTIALGGKRGLDARGQSAIANAIKTQYTYLYGLSREIEAGLPLDARFLARAAMYGQSARASYENIGRERDIEAGYTQERRRIGGPRPCAGCIAEAAKGWRPAGELIKIGGCECLTRRACTFVRRKSKGSATMSHTPTTEGVWSPLVAFGKGGGAKPLAKPADAAGGPQGAPGATPAGTSTGKPGKGKSKGSSKLHGAGNCGTGKGGFRPGNTCGKSGRAKLAEDIRKARASASDHGGHSALRDKVKALKMHRRGHEHAVADDHAGQLRAGLRTGKTARNSKIKAETVAHAHAEVKAAHAVQRARNAAEARRKPVHESPRPEHHYVRHHREGLERARANQAAEKELHAKKTEELALLGRDMAKTYAKANDHSLSRKTRDKHQKAYDELGVRYVKTNDEIATLNWRLDPQYGFHADQLKFHEQGLAKGLADQAAAGPILTPYAPHQANHPDLIAPGTIAERHAKYKVGHAKVKAVDAIGKHYEGVAVRLKETRKKADRIMDKASDRQNTLIDRENARIGDSGGEPSPEFHARIARLEKLVDRMATVKRDAWIADDHILSNQRRDVERILKVDRPARFESSDVEAGFETKSGPLGPMTAGTRHADGKAREFLGNTVARGDSDVLHQKVGEGEGYRAHQNGTYIQARVGESADTMVHEYGHAIDEHVKVGSRSVNDSSQEFLKHRVGDEPLIDMHEKFKAGDPGEMGRKDRFREAMGSEYRAHYTGKSYGEGASEITSMGLEKLYSDPVGFVRADPEYARHIFGIMDGSLR